MKKLLFLLLIGGIFGNIEAQENRTAFLTKMEVEWLDKEITALQSTFQQVKSGIYQKDGIKVSENKTEIIKSVTSITSNSRIFYNKIVMDIDRQEVAKSRVSDTPPDYYYNKRKADDRSVEIVLSGNSLEKFKANQEKMEKIKSSLKATSYAFHPHQTEAMENLDLLESFITAAKNNNRIIQNNLVIE